MEKAVCSRETETRHEVRAGAATGFMPTAISIGWRTVLGSAAGIALLVAVPLYTVLQFREVSTLSIELVSQRYPAIESAKWLLTNLYAQLASEKKYLAVRDPLFLMEFRDEAEEFTQTLTVLQSQESSPEGRKLLGETEQLYADYRLLFRTHVTKRADRPAGGAADYEKKRNAVVAQLAQRLQAYVGLHETRVSGGVKEVHQRANRAHVLTHLMVVVMLSTLVALGLAVFSLRCRWRRRQEQGDPLEAHETGATVEGGTPGLLRPIDTGRSVFTPRAWRQKRPAVPQ